MNFSNSYVRALVASSGMFFAMFLRLFPEYRSGDPHRMAFLFSMLGVLFVASTLLVGAFSSRSEKPWPWLKVGFATLGCWVVAAYAMLLIQKTFPASSMLP